MSAVPNLPASIIDTSLHDSESIQKNAPHTTLTTKGTTNDASRTFELPDLPADHSRPLKVIVIGAGLSGIYLGIRIPERLRNVDLVIYDKNDGVGGTWFENKYPGCACDIPCESFAPCDVEGNCANACSVAHSYQFSFNPNTHWSALYAPAPEIQAYLASTVKKYSVDRFIKLSHKVEECNYNESTGKWHVKVTNLVSGDVFEDTSDILVNARGGLNNINWPDIPGFKSFKGEVMHSAKWNDRFVWEGQSRKSAVR